MIFWLTAHAPNSFFGVFLLLRNHFRLLRFRSPPRLIHAHKYSLVTIYRHDETPLRYCTCTVMHAHCQSFNDKKLKKNSIVHKYCYILWHIHKFDKTLLLHKIRDKKKKNSQFIIWTISAIVCNYLCLRCLLSLQRAYTWTYGTEIRR